jgi:hypothetical protein
MPFLGMRGTGDWVQNQRPENWREMILRLYPNGSVPLTAIMSKMSSQSTDDPVYHWWDKSLPSQRAVPTGIYTDAALTAAYASGGSAGDFLYLKMAEADSKQFMASHQVLLRASALDLDADVTGIVTACVQNGTSSYIKVALIEDDDNSTSADMSDCDVVYIIGSANAEGGATPTAVGYDPTEHSNYTQIFRNSLDHTRTAAKTRLRTGDQVAEAKRECLELHGIEMEKALILGKLALRTGSNGKPERYTNGIRAQITTNKSNYTKQAGVGNWVDGGDEWLDNILEQIFRYGSNEKMALCGSGAILGINKLAKAKGTFNMTAKTMDYGIQVVEVVTAFGTMYMKNHPLFTYEPTLRNSMLICEPRFFKYRYVDDTKYKPETQANNIDGKQSEYLTEAGLELHFEQAHGWLDGVGQNSSVPA